MARTDHPRPAKRPEHADSAPRFQHKPPVRRPQQRLAAEIADEDDYDGTPCCPDSGCSGNPCTFPGYTPNN